MTMPQLPLPDEALPEPCRAQVIAADYRSALDAWASGDPDRAFETLLPDLPMWETWLRLRGFLTLGAAWCGEQLAESIPEQVREEMSEDGAFWSFALYNADEGEIVQHPETPAAFRAQGISQMIIAGANRDWENLFALVGVHMPERFTNGNVDTVFQLMGIYVRMRENPGAPIMVSP